VKTLGNGCPDIGSRFLCSGFYIYTLGEIGVKFIKLVF